MFMQSVDWLNPRGSEIFWICEVLKFLSWKGPTLGDIPKKPSVDIIPAKKWTEVKTNTPMKTVEDIERMIPSSSPDKKEALDTSNSKEKCTKCGFGLQNSVKFCNQCGTKVSDTAAISPEIINPINK
jgi:hypothetical protein